VKWSPKKVSDDKNRPVNIDMWQKYNDCILCDQKSIPNSQGVLLLSNSRNILVGFNKTLQVWKYENTAKKTQKVQGIYVKSKGQEKLPIYLQPKEQEEPLIVKSYYNGVKNYSWVQNEPQVQGSSQYLANRLGPMGSYLSESSSLLKQQDSMRQFIHIMAPAVNAEQRYSGVSYQFYNPVSAWMVKNNTPETLSHLDHFSDYGTQY
jgi:hypothetical protein